MAWRVMILKTISAMFSHEDPAGLVNLRFVQLTVKHLSTRDIRPFRSFWHPRSDSETKG